MASLGPPAKSTCPGRTQDPATLLALKTPGSRPGAWLSQFIGVPFLFALLVSSRATLPLLPCFQTKVFLLLRRFRSPRSTNHRLHFLASPPSIHHFSLSRCAAASWAVARDPSCPRALFCALRHVCTMSMCEFVLPRFWALPFAKLGERFSRLEGPLLHPNTQAKLRAKPGVDSSFNVGR